mmetsp:Transcript_11996/g.36450  ORF Transcript_11996/g.36450 Transcript_11996/m.36450 type:complete len:234 (-) Transcript_11996:1007-1708(-)
MVSMTVPRAAAAALPSRRCQGSLFSATSRRNPAGSSSRRSNPRCQAMKNWEVMQPDLYKMLESGDFVTSPPEEVLDMVEDGKAVLVDVRLAEDYEQVHAINAKSVPLFQRIQTVSVENAIKSVFYALNGVKGTEENPNFVSGVEEVFRGLGQGQRLYFMCDAGGTCEAVPGFIYGKQSRSLQAVYKAVDEANVPADMVGHVAGGLRGWAGAGNLGLTGEDVDSWKKKAGAVPF